MDEQWNPIQQKSKVQIKKTNFPARCRVRHGDAPIEALGEESSGIDHLPTFSQTSQLQGARLVETGLHLSLSGCSRDSLGFPDNLAPWLISAFKKG